MRMQRRMYRLLLSVFLAGCGGSGGGTTTAPPPPPPPPVNALMGGIWFGVMNFDMAMGSELSVALLTDDGRFRILTDPTLSQFAGNQQIDINDVVGSGTGFVAPGGAWPDGTTVTSVSLDATLVERDTFSGNWSTTSGESGDFEFFYDAEYERTSALPLLEGVWTAYDDTGVVTATFTIENTGLFNAQNVNGCVSNGQFSIIDSNYNLYQVDSTISNCPIAGDYSGLAVMGENNVPDDAIFLAISNDLRGLFIGLEK